MNQEIENRCCEHCQIHHRGRIGAWTHRIFLRLTIAVARFLGDIAGRIT